MFSYYALAPLNSILNCIAAILLRMRLHFHPQAPGAGSSLRA